MKLDGMRIKVKLPLTFALVIAGYAGVLGYVVYAYQTALAADARQDAFVLNAVDMARQAQVDFKIQVQEWKNTLLRGLDPKAFEKYSAAFTKTEAEVQARLAALKGMLSGAGRDTGDVEKLAASHRELGDKYRSALKSYDSADGKSPQRVDTAVTGIDRAPTKAMDGLVAAIQEMGAQRQVEAAREHRRLQMTLLALALAVTPALRGRRLVADALHHATARRNRPAPPGPRRGRRGPHEAPRGQDPRRAGSSVRVVQRLHGQAARHHRPGQGRGGSRGDGHA